MNLIRLLPLLGLFLLPAGIALADYDEGIEYKRLATPVSTVDPNKIEVVELFWYGCPHCYRLEPELKAWLKNKPDNVVFVRVPAVFRPLWKFHADVYYTAEVLGVLDQINDAMFEAMQVQRRKMKTVEEVKALFAKHGVSSEKFENAFNSFAVDAKVRRAVDLTRRYGIEGVPALVINGKYVTDGVMAKGNRGMFEVTDYLIKKESSSSK
ncbi:MAG: thiol:disulfide interchange protein DsbA/DsbL [Gammaproteobacteria bacterium]|nr:thiol:disulfide interchange protein DsbA/DsbL [Gammaproteobacteria bacterium]